MTDSIDGEPAILDRLRAEIDTSGPVSFARFMERALYEPGLGYYERGAEVLGKSGDFFTSSDVGDLFGFCIARQLTEMDERLGEEEPPAEAGEDLAAREAITRAFRRLPPKLQIVATLALIEELPYQEIAEALELPLGTVKSRLSRANRRLRAMPPVREQPPSRDLWPEMLSRQPRPADWSWLDLGAAAAIALLLALFPGVFWLLLYHL